MLDKDQNLLKKLIMQFIREEGSKSFVLLLSKSIDEAGPSFGNSIHENREVIKSGIIFYNKKCLLDR